MAKTKTKTKKGNETNVSSTDTTVTGSLKAGNRTFDSQGQLDEWVSEMESTIGRQGNEMGDLNRKVSDMSDKLQAQYTAPEPTVKGDSEFYEKFETLLYSDAKKAAELMEKRFDEKYSAKLESERSVMREEFRGHSEEERFWTDFVGKNPGLAPMIDDIRLVTAVRLDPKIKNLGREEQMDRISKYFGSQIETSRDLLGSQEVDGGRSTVEPGSGATGTGGASGASNDDATSKTTFFDEIQSSSYHPRALQPPKE